MSERNDGGPAFPCYWMKEGSVLIDGMTLRDYFAGQALSFIKILSLDRSPVGGAVAQIAYEIADAMLKERIK